MPKPSDLSLTDMFCGAGGSSTGAVQAGVPVYYAFNHWQRALETHAENHRETHHDLADISGTDPRRYRSTRMLWASPECTNHSLAKGVRRKNLQQGDFFQDKRVDPSAIRSRATMWDVWRFAEVHDYDLIFVENVVDARHWIMWDAWWLAGERLGYRGQCVYANSMFHHPTPQSRDRMYVVWWKKGNRAPDLEFRPTAWCPRCARTVESIQSWKPGRTWGRYRRQYVYCCPGCTSIVEPYYYAALNAIDWTIPAERIRDRAKPLRERTLRRIAWGLERFGRQPLQLITNMTTDGGRVRRVTDPGFTQTGSMLTALVHPYVVETLYTQAGDARAASTGEPLPAQTGRRSLGLVLPWLVTAGSRETAPSSTESPVLTLTGSERFGVAMPPAFLVGTSHASARSGYARAVAEAMATQTTAQDVGVAVAPGAALMTMRDPKGGYLFSELAEPLFTQMTMPQAAVIARAPFLTSYYGNEQGASVAEAMDTLSTKDRHALVEPGEALAVEDCYFRMLQAHEVKWGMAFPRDYIVLGTASEQVKQAGNAVTPPAARDLIARGIASLEGD